MKYLFFLLMACSFAVNSHAQKKLVPVSQSVLTGVMLPEGSKQDKRMLMIGAAEILLEMESKKYGTGIATTEVLTLPAVAVCGFNSDSLVSQLTKLGWGITPVDNDDKYVWLMKDNRYVIAFFSTDKKETSLYFGLAANPPALGGGNIQQVATNLIHKQNPDPFYIQQQSNASMFNKNTP
jgi:hypothetical protein